MNEIGDRLKKVRRHYQLNLIALSEKMGVSRNTIINYEKGKRKPDVDYLSKFVSEFKVNCNWLITGKGNMLLSGNKDDLMSDMDFAKKRYPGLPEWEYMRIARNFKTMEYRLFRNEIDEIYDYLPKKLKLISGGDKELELLRAIQDG